MAARLRRRVGRRRGHHTRVVRAACRQRRHLEVVRGGGGMTTAYERLLDALTEHGSVVKQHGSSKATAQCPSHDDRTPSLSITGIEGCVLLTCRAGCDTADVLAKLGWTLADLYD